MLQAATALPRRWDVDRGGAFLPPLHVQGFVELADAARVVFFRPVAIGVDAGEERKKEARCTHRQSLC